MKWLLVLLLAVPAWARDLDIDPVDCDKPPPLEVVSNIIRVGSDVGKGSAVQLQDGSYLSAAHVQPAIEDARDLIVGDKNDTSFDLMSFRLEPTAPGLPLMRARDLKLYQDVWAVGFPGPQRIAAKGQFQSMSDDDGIISTAMVIEGMSGGGLLACDGLGWQVVGVIVGYQAGMDLLRSPMGSIPLPDRNRGLSYSAFAFKGLERLRDPNYVVPVAQVR